MVRFYSIPGREAHASGLDGVPLTYLRHSEATRLTNTG